MAITGISSNAAVYSADQNSSLAKFKENFEKLGKALESGKISDAKNTLTQLQKGFTANYGSSVNPIGNDLTSLGKTLNSGDIQSAQQIFSKIQERLVQRRSAQTGGNGGGNESAGINGYATSSQSQGAYNATTRVQTQVAAQNMSAMVTAVNPVNNPMLGAFINTIA